MFESPDVLIVQSFSLFFSNSVGILMSIFVHKNGLVDIKKKKKTKHFCFALLYF